MQAIAYFVGIKEKTERERETNSQGEIEGAVSKAFNKYACSHRHVVRSNNVRRRG